MLETENSNVWAPDHIAARGQKYLPLAALSLRCSRRLEDFMTSDVLWPRSIAAIVAVIVGVLLLLGGGGHLSAILEERAGQPFDYRFVSLLTTSGILMLPGVVGIVTSYWLWRGRTWAYVSCLLSASALMLYLGLLMYMKAQVPEVAVGSEVYFMTGFVATYMLVTLGVFLWLRGVRTRSPIDA